MKISLIILLLLSLLTSACTQMRHNTCPKSTLGQCRSMGEMNHLVDQGVFEEQSSVTPTLQESTTELATPLGTQSSCPNQSIPVWIAPYEDEHGNKITAHTIVAHTSSPQNKDLLPCSEN